MHPSTTLALTFAAFSAAELHIYYAYTAGTDFAGGIPNWKGLAFFDGEPSCDDVTNGNSGQTMTEITGDASNKYNARCDDCTDYKDKSPSEFDIKELEWNNAIGHFTIYGTSHTSGFLQRFDCIWLMDQITEGRDYKITPADGSELRGSCRRDSEHDFKCVGAPNANYNTGTRLFICDTDLSAEVN